MKIVIISLVIASLSCTYAQDLIPDERMTMEGKKWGYKNRYTGEKVTKAIYDVAYEFKGNFAIVKKGDKLAYINSKGKEITPFKYDKAEDFINGFAKVQVLDKLGFIDSTGKELTDIKFMRLNNFKEGFATASLDDLGRTGFIDSKGKMSSRFYFDNAGSYNEGMVWVELRGKVGFLNKMGDEIIKPNYDWGTDFVKGYAIVMKKNKYGCVDRMGKEFIPLNYNLIKRYGPDSAYIITLNKDLKYGIYGNNGKPLLPELFAKISDYQNYGGKLYAAVYRTVDEIFFYIDDKVKCVEFDGKVCPEE
ncbi:MAG: WG repeat-containing protein [Cytophagales bacterium]|nr:WG repeat-containing protein [Cytophagales bacterium]